MKKLPNICRGTANMSHSKEVGKWGEDQACAFLARHGFKILERNYFTAGGELDIVAVKGGDYYFVEVKTRQDNALANDLAVTFFKRNRLEKAIKHFCYHRQVSGEVALITAVLIVLVDKRSKRVKFTFTALY